MLFEVRVKPASFSFVIDLIRHCEELKKSVPIDTVLRVWKEEVYFEVPFKLNVRPDVCKVEKGGVYYWPPGPALCVFFGHSQPYTPVTLVGKLIGPSSRLRWIEDGCRAEVTIHEVCSEQAELVELLKKLNYSTATPIEDEERVTTASKTINNLTLAFTVYSEPYGYYVETDSIYKYGEDLASTKFIHRVSEEVMDKYRFVRVDLSEDRFVVLSVAVNDISELEFAINELERAYPVVVNYIKQPS